MPAPVRAALTKRIDPPRLIERNARPKHWETTLAALDGSFFTPIDDFFLRSHLGEGGRQDLAHGSIRVEGMVRRPASLSLAAIAAMPRHEIACTLECAGNGRGLYRLANTSGTQWEYGAVGTARWAGVRLADVLEHVGADSNATHLWMRGADWLGIGSLPVFERSIPLEKARADALLAFEMNGKPLPFFHGGPVRLVVPGWYGMAWIKWPEAMRLENRPCDGHFMARSYHWQYPGEDPAKAAPVERVRVKSLLTSHADGVAVPRAPLTVGGWAWSGEGEVTRVDVSTDGLVSWHAAQLTESHGPFAWRRWQHPLRPAAAGPLAIAVRATDASGAVQPVATRPNLGGYGNNSIHRVTLHVRG